MRSSIATRGVLAAVLLLMLGALVAGCGGDDEESSGGSGEKKFEGERINVLTGWPGQEGDAFRAVLDQFTEETGIEVDFRGTPEVETELKVAVDGKKPPDLSFVPQPGLLNEFYEKGSVKPLDSVVDPAALEQSMIPGSLDVAKANKDGKLIAVPFRLAVKSLVWYNAKAFQQGGYKAPTTMEELQQLVGQIKADGKTPWCISDNEGWTLTDWVEDVVLRTAGPDVYDRWTKHELNFNSPEIEAALEEFDKLALADGNVLGGRKAIVGLEWSAALQPLIAGKCVLLRQAGFLRENLPDGVEPGKQVKTFYLPAGESGGQPVLGFGDQIALFSDKPAAKELVKFLSKPEAGAEWAKQSAYLSPHKEFDQSLLSDAQNKYEAEILAKADPFRFDASDLMPSAVGAGSFWNEMKEFAAGKKSADQATQAIDASWPKQ